MTQDRGPMSSGLRNDTNPPKPEGNKNTLFPVFLLRQQVYKTIRTFFGRNDYFEVETPLLVASPGIDPHINAFGVEGNMYLAPSPELQMKRLMGMGLKRIFQITRAFRRGEQGILHNPEFSLLEWYHSGVDYLFLMDESEALIREVITEARQTKIQCAASESIETTQAPETIRPTEAFNIIDLPDDPFPRYPVDDLFETHAGWRPSEDWHEERFFLDLIERVEPHIAQEPVVIIYDFPAPLASMSRLKKGDPRVCERFEIYLNGMELANAFSELTDPVQQKGRFIQAQEQRKMMGEEPYPIDNKFLDILKEGLFPPCAGIALGLDRLLMAITGVKDIGKVMTFPFSSL